MKQNKNNPNSFDLNSFLRLMLKRVAIYTSIILCFLIIGYYLRKQFVFLPYLPIPYDTITLVPLFIWVIGIVIIGWNSWVKRPQTLHKTPEHIENKEQLQKTILRRYQNSFLVSAALYTLVLLLIAAMIYLVRNSRIWHEEDHLFLLLRFLNDVSPFAGVALWVGGIAFLLYRQWRQSASDVVGLIGSIEQMQSEQEGLIIEVPNDLPEVQPILQKIHNQRQIDRRIARESEQRKNELIVYLAHDLKTPLTSIVGYLSLMIEQPKMPLEKRAEYCRIALDKAFRLENLIDQFFEVSRYNMSEMVLENDRIDLKYLLMQLSDEFFPLLEPQGKSFVLNLPEELWVYGDADKLARVFNNILRNAVAYSYPQTSIQINAIEQDAQVTVIIKNQGNTIPAAQLQNIFHKFYRLDEARSSNTGGAGLGLAIAQEIVLLHGGEINAESSDETITFTVLLPHNKG